MMDGMDDLVQFLRARLDEDEQTARAATSGWYSYDPEQAIAFVPVEDTQHIARHSPARVLAEVDAKRQIMELHEPADTEDATEPVCMTCDDLRGIEPAYPCRTLRFLALPYAGHHPDYRDTWRP